MRTKKISNNELSDILKVSLRKLKGLSYDEIFTTHCTYRALKELKDDVITGNTGTNVMNIRVVVIR